MLPKVGVVGRICFVRWYGSATAEHVRAVVDAFLETRRTLGRSFVLVAQMPRDAELPDANALAEIVRAMPIVEHLYDWQYAVVPAVGVRAKLLRGGIQIVNALTRNPITVVETVGEAIEQACRTAGDDPQRVLAEAREKGLLDEAGSP